MKLNHALKHERMDPAPGSIPGITPGNPWIERLEASTEDVLDTDLHLVHLPGFHVHDIDSANWVVRKIVECRQYAERAKSYAAAEVARAEREERFFRWRYGPQLEAWFDRERESGDRPGPQRKSLNLPAGKIGRRSCSAKLEVLDTDSVLSWAKSHCPNAIAVEEKLSKSALNAHFDQTGELPDGVLLTEAKEVFYVK